ncbi:MAG: hypothetical protein HKN09_01570 [Saprospiraceae bacterium]|nr:hypothetical protein [Saprospiraceae bacterium]
MGYAKYYLMAFGLVLLCFFSACDKGATEKAPDVSEIELTDFSFSRFDQEVIQMDTNDIVLAYKKLSDKYPYLTDLYFKRLMAMPFENQDSFYRYVREFVAAEPIRKLQSSVDQVYANEDHIVKELKQACRYLRYYFPDKTLPSFYTFITEFGYQNIIFSDGDRDAPRDGIGIGLDFFLGENYEYKTLDPRNPAFSDYITRAYNKDHVVKKSLEVWINDALGNPPGKRFIDQMIYNGKRLYLLNKVLPFIQDTVIFEYTPEQLAWVEANELEMWSFFLDNELLYQTDQRKNIKYLNPAPHSPGMPPQAPGRTANYIGWKIVDAYMNRNKDKSLQDLIAMQDAQELMQLSKYKPRRR